MLPSENIFFREGLILNRILLPLQHHGFVVEESRWSTGMPGEYTLYWFNTTHGPPRGDFLLGKNPETDVIWSITYTSLQLLAFPNWMIEFCHVYGSEHICITVCDCVNIVFAPQNPAKTVEQLESYIRWECDNISLPKVQQLVCTVQRLLCTVVKRRGVTTQLLICVQI